MTLHLENLYETRIDSTRSINYYSGFDCYCDAVFFSLCDGDTGEELKSYEVSFDEDTGEVSYDVEFTSEHDSGYCDFKRLPKSVREHVLAIVKAYIEEQTEESEEKAETVETEQADSVEVEVQYATGERQIVACGSVAKALDIVSGINNCRKSREKFNLKSDAITCFTIRSHGEAVISISGISNSLNFIGVAK